MKWILGVERIAARCAAAVLCCWGAAAFAHEYKGMSTQVQIEPTSATVVLHLAATDALLLSPPLDRNKDSRMQRQEYDAGRTMLEQGVPLMLKFTSNGIPLLPQSASVDVIATEGFTDEPHALKFTMTYGSPGGVAFGRIVLDPNLFRSFTRSPIDGSAVKGTQRNTVTILDRGKQVTLQATGKEIYDSGGAAGVQVADSITSTSTSTSTSGRTTGTEVAAGQNSITSTSTSTGGSSLAELMRDFLVQGILHILKGWDHVFFVTGIIFAAQNLKTLVKVITAFTVAHTITLILTSLNVLHISKPQIVEAIIAASVAYVGLENIVFNNRPVPWRWGLVFAFGLVHGLGFASVLRELLGEGSAAGGSKVQLVTCLLTFNVGVEIGQMLILCILWPTLMLLRRRKPVVAKWAVIGVSALVMFMGTSFLLDRTVLPKRLPWVAWFNG